MTELSQKILDAARDEVVQDYDFHIEGKCQTWNQFVESAIMDNSEMDFLLYSERAALLAMEKLAEFYKWILLEDEWQLCLYKGNLMYVERARSEDSGLTEDFFKTELELYEIWGREQK